MENNPEPSVSTGTRRSPSPVTCGSRRTTSWKKRSGKFFRLFPGNEVRLKGAYVVKCTGCMKDDGGNVTEVLCEYDPDSRGGDPADGRKIKSTIHWVDAATCARPQRSASTTTSSPTRSRTPQTRTSLIA